MSEGDKVFPTICAQHCGGTCLLKAHVRDGAVTRLETDDGVEPQLRACPRGRAFRQVIYAPDRLRYPLRRVGERGSGEFKRVSWDEALDVTAAALIRVRGTYGPKSILYLSMAGDAVCLNNATVGRVLSLAGGYTTRWGTASFHGGIFASSATYGTIHTANTRDDLLNSRLIILWGWDPALTVAGPNTGWFLARAREQGTRVVAVDPRFTDSAATYAGEWIPIRPGTDTAVLIAMAHTIITRGLEDADFIARHTVGFEVFKDYVLGTGDGIPKTAAWAEAISGVPAAMTAELAQAYATTRPAALLAGVGPGRSDFGEQYHRAANVLAAITGNLGIPGGDAAGRAWESTFGGYPYPVSGGDALPAVPNPVEPPLPKASPGRNRPYVYPRLHYAQVADAILKGQAGGYPADYKLAFLDNTNYLNSFPNVNKIVKALKSLEFIAAFEQFMTATTRYADIIFPTTTFMEREDMALGVGMAYYGYQPRILPPQGEARPQREIARDLATRLGLEDYDDADSATRLKHLAARAQIPDLEAFKAAGVYRIEMAAPHVAFRENIADPAGHPFPTPSGKIEIFSQQLADLANPLLPPIPRYLPATEGRDSPLAVKYPLQLLTNHAKHRANAKLDNIPWLRELCRQEVTLNTRDARVRDIRDGDAVRVFNDRGEIRLPALVTDRIMPGVAVVPAGAWYQPDADGVDIGGCANVLTRDEPSPGGAFPYNTTLIEAEKLIGPTGNLAP